MASKGSSVDAEVIEAAEGDDVTVLSVEEVGEATASGGGVKRRKIVSSSDVSDAGDPAAKEGADKVALCGSDCAVGQQQLNLGQKNSGCPQPGNKPSILLPTHRVKGPCSRCGLGGHRDGDCDVGLEEGVGGGSAPVVTEDGNVPDMACPCRSGKCLVLTSNTAKNPGRKFYTCPLPLNNGGCYFFKWCDQPNPGPALSQKASNKYSTPVFKIRRLTRSLARTRAPNNLMRVTTRVAIDVERKVIGTAIAPTVCHLHLIPLKTQLESLLLPLLQTCASDAEKAATGPGIALRSRFPRRLMHLLVLTCASNAARLATGLVNV